MSGDLLFGPDQFALTLNGLEIARFHRIDAGVRGRISADVGLKLLDWLELVVARPDTRVGRPGPVCPLVPRALRVGALWLGLVRLESGCPPVKMQSIARTARTMFEHLKSRSAGEQLSFMMVFPTLTQDEAHAQILACVTALRIEFLHRGLMFSDFSPQSMIPSLRNEHFFPFRSPVPMLGIRDLVEEDVAFFELTAGTDPERALVLLDTYLTIFRVTRPEGSGVARAEALRVALLESGGRT